MFALHPTLDFVTAGLHVCLASLTLRHARSHPLGAPFLMLSVTLAGWLAARAFYFVTGQPFWNHVDIALVALVPPLALYVILAFVGRLRRYRWVPLTVLAIATPACWITHALGGSALLPFVAGSVPGLVLGTRLLVRHARDVADEAERARARVMLAALAVGVGLGSLQFLTSPAWATDLGSLGVLVASVLMAVGAVRLSWLGVEVTPWAMAFALATTGITILAAYGVLSAAGTGPAATIVGAAMTGALTLFLGRRALETFAAARERNTQLMTLGLFARQMAHDLRNPLAAVKGTLQYLEADYRHNRPLESYRPQVELMLWQSARMERIIADYHRMGRVEVHPVRAQLNPLVERAAREPFADVAVTLELSPSLPAVNVDEDLVVAAIENVVRNAAEAQPGGGTVVVRTRADRAFVELVVEDQGPGMDARARERAFDLFFTTKEMGTGLGLAYVRRVLHAHGGRVRLWSHPGKGTRVTMSFPAAS